MFIVVFFFYHCYSELPQTQWLQNDTYLLSYGSVGHTSNVRVTELKSRCWQNSIPFWRLRLKPVFCLFQPLEATRTPGLRVPSSSKSTMPVYHFSHHFTLMLTLPLSPSSTFKIPYNYSRSSQ